MLLTAVAFLVGGNNAAVAAATAVGSRVIRKSTGLQLTSFGYLFGLFFEGTKLSRLRTELLPVSTDGAVVLVLAVSATIFVLADIRRVPASLTYALVGSLVGLTLAVGVSLNLAYLGETILLWLAGPLLVLTLSLFMARALSQRGGNSWQILQFYRVGILVSVCFSAYALGANTLGAIVSVVPSAGPVDFMVVGAGGVLGALILGRGPLSRVGEEIYALGYTSAFLSQTLGAAVIEFSTQAGIPLSATRIVTSSTLGVGLSRSVRILNLKTVMSFVAEWAAVPLVAFALTFTLGRFVHL